ncbi:hypothetical protein J7E70_02135 [Variovorax paradoxus]|nr:hypothetical protein [Variovorax paradoxus]MBT2299253.1 hypothetical protein [Variovorax paradoxus]
MTKPSAILVCPVVPLHSIPPGEVDVIRRFLFQHMRGMDRRNDKRWRRLWGRLWKAEPGEGFQLYSAEERSGPFHRRHRVILERLFQSQERFREIDALHDWMKIGAYWVTWGEGRRGQPVPKPRSTSFPECSEDEMREAHAAMVDYLHTERAQRFLWRHLKAPQRAEMLESVLARPDEEGGRP